METTLVPKSYIRIISTVRRIAIFAVAAVLPSILLLWITGVIRDTATAGIALGIGYLITVPMLLPGMLYSRVCQSKAVFQENILMVQDKRGRAWRQISYRDISAVQVKTVSGFFYGKNKNEIQGTYICFFLRGAKEMPQGTLKQLFYKRNFFLVCYDQKVFDALPALLGRKVRFLAS